MNFDSKIRKTIPNSSIINPDHNMFPCLQSLETLDNGKPYRNAFGDMMFAMKVMRYYAGWADKWQGRTCPVG